MESRQARGGIKLRVEQDSIDDEPQEQRLNHFQAAGDQGQGEKTSDAVMVRPKPVKILAHVLASFAATLLVGVCFGGIAVRSVQVIQPLALVLFAKAVIPVP